MNDIYVDMLFVLNLIFVFGNVDVYGASHVSVEDINGRDHYHAIISTGDSADITMLKAEFLQLKQRQALSDTINQKLQKEIFGTKEQWLDLNIKYRDLEAEFSQLKQTQQVSEFKCQRLQLEVQKLNETLINTQINNQKLKVDFPILKEKEFFKECKDSVPDRTNFVEASSSPHSLAADSPSIEIEKRFLSETNHKVAFTAVLTHGVTLGYLQTVNFDKIITNIGSAYDSNDGHLIAPFRGLYLISTSLFHGDTAQIEPIEIVRNGIQLAAVYLHSGEQKMGSQTITVLLEKGDKVWLRRFRDQGFGSLFGLPNQQYCSFSGVLLYEM